MKKKIAIDFFHVVTQKDAPTMETLLDHAMKLKLARKANGKHIALETCIEKDGIYEGDVARAKLTDLPDRMKTDGSRRAIDYDTNEGLGFVASFVFEKKSGILVIQRNRMAVSADDFVSYLSARSKDESPIETKHIPAEGALEALRHAKLARRFSLNLAIPGNLKPFEKMGMGLGAALKEWKEVGATVVDIQLSVGREKKGTLKKTKIAKAAKYLISAVGIRRCEATIRDEVTGKAKSRILDLLAYRLTEHADVLFEKDNKRLLSSSRTLALRTAFNKWRTYAQDYLKDE